MSIHPVSTQRKTLQSWKEIADHLNVTVRTAQRWREQGMPVHDLGTGPKARVAAYTDELEQWILEERYKGLGALTLTVKHSIRSRRWLVPAILLALLLIAAGVWGYRAYFSAAIPDHLEVANGYLSVFDKQNRLCWRQFLPGLNSDAYNAQSMLGTSMPIATSPNASLIEDVDGDGRAEILFNYWPKSLYESSGKLICFNQNGKLRWEFQLGRERSYGTRRFSSNYLSSLVRSVEAHGRKWILSVAHHDYWFPSHAVLLDPRTAEIHQEYWHPGWFYLCNVYDLDGDGSQEILLAGPNNPGTGLGHIGLAVLKVAATRQPLVPDPKGMDMQEFTGGGELAYRLFPRSDIVAAAGLVPSADILAIVDKKQILIRINGPDRTDILYHLDFSFQVTQFVVADAFASVHQQLQRQGRLDHALTEAEMAELGKVQAFQTAPHGNSPEVDRFWKLP